MSHPEEQAVNFLMNLFKFMWEWDEGEVSSFVKNKEREEIQAGLAAMRSRIDSAKLWMLEVLSQLGKIDLLYPYSLVLEEGCVTKLRLIALRTELVPHAHSILDSREALTLEEACYAGSPEAQFLMLMDVSRAEHERLSALHKAELEKREAERKIASLSSVK